MKCTLLLFFKVVPIIYTGRQFSLSDNYTFYVVKFLKLVQKIMWINDRNVLGRRSRIKQIMSVRPWMFKKTLLCSNPFIIQEGGGGIAVEFIDLS